MAVGKGFHIADAYVEIYADKDKLKADLASLGSDLGPSAEKGGRDVGSRIGKGIGDGADGKGVGKKVVKDTTEGAKPDADKGGKDIGDKLSKGMQLAIVRNSPLIAAAVAGGLLAGTPVMLGAATTLFMGIGILAAAQSQKVKQAWAGTWDTIKTEAQEDASVIAPTLERAASRIGQAFTALRPQMRGTFATIAPEVDNLTTSFIRASNDGLGGMMTAVQRSGPVMSGLDRMLESIGSGLGAFFVTLSTKAPEAGDALAAIGRIVSSLLSILATFLTTGASLGSVILPALASVLEVVAKALQAIAPILPIVVSGLTALKVAQSVSGWMKAAGDDVGKFQGAVQKAAGAVPGLAGALPLIGAGIALLLTAYAQHDQAIEKLARGMLDGGRAAEESSQMVGRATQFYEQFGTGITGVLGRLTGYGAALDAAKNAQGDMEKKARDLYNAMSPLEQKQQDVTKATNDLELAVSKYGVGSGQAMGASITLKEKQDALTRAQEQLEQATHGVTQAMIDQANQALAAADSNFALQEATWRTKDAEDAVKKAIHDHGATSEEAQRATLQFSEALSSQAAAAGRAAADASGLTDKMELQKVQQAATLQSLLQLRDQYGANFPAALQQSIARMQAAGVTLDWLGNKHETPTVDTNLAPFTGNMAWVNQYLTYIGNRVVYPTAWAIAQVAGAEAALNYAARTRYSTIYVSTIGSLGMRGIAAEGGNVGRVVRGLASGGSAISGGKLFGPGGPTDDLIHAVTTSGDPLRVSPLEWVIKASSALKYGDAKMKAINDGTASVSVGSSPGLYRGDSGSGSGGASVVIQNLTIPITGTMDLTNPASLRKIAATLRDAIIDMERETR